MVISILLSRSIHLGTAALSMNGCSMMNTTEVAMMVSCMQIMDVEKKAETHRRMFSDQRTRS